MSIEKLESEINDEFKTALFAVIKQAVFAKPDELVPHTKEITDLCCWAVHHNLIPAKETEDICQWIHAHNTKVRSGQYNRFII